VVDCKRSLWYSKAANWAASRGGSTCRSFLREPGQGLGDVRVILDETPVHVTHAQEALGLRLATRGKRFTKALDVLLVHHQIPWTDDMSQVLHLLLEQVAHGGLA